MDNYRIDFLQESNPHFISGEMKRETLAGGGGGGVVLDRYSVGHAVPFPVLQQHTPGLRLPDNQQPHQSFVLIQFGLRIECSAGNSTSHHARQSLCQAWLAQAGAELIISPASTSAVCCWKWKEREHKTWRQDGYRDTAAANTRLQARQAASR